MNKRAVLATRNIGAGHQRLVKFVCVMNMLLVMNKSACQDHVQAMCEAATHTATDKVKPFEPDKEGVYNIAVSGDETWQKEASLHLMAWLLSCPLSLERLL